MLPVIIIVAAIVILIIGYFTYGSWLCKKWGIDPNRKTPAYENEDGVDYVPAKPAVLLGHHFSSIAGAGPINGPIQAAVFGWVPVFLWCVLGGIFFGGLQDFGSLFASIRHDGKSLGEIIKDTMGQRAKKLFLVFGLLVLILVIASFVNVVAGTFFTEEGGFGFAGNPTNNQTTAMISLLFIVLAVIYGYVTNKMNVKTLPASICGIIGIIIITIIGLNCGFVMGRTAWIVFIGIYIVVASLVPVWILLQPRDYLSSFLLYAMMGIAVIGILVAAFTKNAQFTIPAVTGWKTGIGTMFPALFITVACGACSGFHSLISTGTTSKQLKNEKDANALETVRSLFSTKTKDFITAVDEKNIILVKEVKPNETYEDMAKTASMIEDMLNTEVMTQVHIAYGTVVSEIKEVSRSYKEAKMALDVGKIFYESRSIIAYSNLGIGRLIYQLPIPLCKMFIKEIFEGKSPDEFDEETLTTINKFFENSLNVSETSRQLFIHRNTLIYRIEKLQKTTGLDIRVFDDALTLKIALMVVNYMKYVEKTD